MPFTDCWRTHRYTTWRVVLDMPGHGLHTVLTVGIIEYSKQQALQRLLLRITQSPHIHTTRSSRVLARRMTDRTTHRATHINDFYLATKCK